MEESSRLVDTGILIAFGGAIGHFFSWVLRFLKLRAEKEERVTDDTFEYATMLRKDMETLKVQMAAMQAKILALEEERVGMMRRESEMSVRVEALYVHNAELVQRNKALSEHVESCVVLQRIAIEEKREN